jgi:ABC-type phosphate/phosphonate transport system substrate-binding protein
MREKMRLSMTGKITGALFFAAAALAPDSVFADGKLTLTLGVNDVYCKDSACECVHKVAARSYDGVIRKLESDGIELHLLYFTDTFALKREIRRGGLDGVICKPSFAFHAAGKDRVFTRLADVLDPRSNQFVTGIVIVKKDSLVKTLADLTGKPVTMGKSDGFEKCQAARKLFAKEGIKPSKITEKSSCIEVIGDVMEGLSDGGVISDYALTADCAVDFAKPDDFRVLANTGKIPLTSVMLDNKKVSAANIERLKAALLKISGSAVPSDFLGGGFAAPAPWVYYEDESGEK